MAFGAPDYSIGNRDFVENRTLIFEETRSASISLVSEDYGSMINNDFATGYGFTRSGAVNDFDVVFDYGRLLTNTVLQTDVKVTNNANSGTFTVRLEVSSDNTNWTQVATASAGASSSSNIRSSTFETFRYVRFYGDDSASGTSSGRVMTIMYLFVGRGDQ